MTTDVRKPGEFCWINVVTPRPEQAREFFARVLGWTYFEMQGLGHGIRVGGCNIGGLFDLDGPNVPPGSVPRIGVMVKVESADAAGEKAAALGGQAEPAFDVLENGRMAVCRGPDGARFDVWEPRATPGDVADRTRHGAPSWFEAMTTDVGRATEFYSGLFGWTPEAMPLPEFTYTVFKLGADPVAGLMPIPPEKVGLQPHWGTYFTVDDVDEAAREAVRLGATVCVPAQDVPSVGRFCGIASPQGVLFYVIRYAR